MDRNMPDWRVPCDPRDNGKSFCHNCGRLWHNCAGSIGNNGHFYCGACTISVPVSEEWVAKQLHLAIAIGRVLIGLEGTRDGG
jgi:hypothetical protein